METVWLAEYTDCWFESGYEVLGVFKFKTHALKAKRRHRKKIAEYNRKHYGSLPDSKIWRIREVNIFNSLDDVDWIVSEYEDVIINLNAKDSQ